MAEADGGRLGAFEARLLALKHKLESGLVQRASALRDLAKRLEAGDDQARKEIKTESHKLRGVAGTYGHDHLTDLAGQLEQRASLSPPAVVGQMTRQLADLAETTGKGSKPPLAPVEPSTPPSRAPKAPAPALYAVLRVLAVDDDPVTQRLLWLTLKQVGGFEPSIVGSAAEGLALLSSQVFDVIIADAMMPDMNGRDFRREARARGARVPILILSAASPEELGWTEGTDSSDAWLRKPFKPTLLVQDIARIVENYRRSG